jgi:chromosomal replication initiation ATPase DnaA
MNTLQEIPNEELQGFKLKVGKWLELDEKIAILEKQARELKKIRNKELEPEITKFMVNFNITDLNTNTGKLRCNERNTKKPINKINIRENLSKIIAESEKVDQAIDLIWTNREVVTTYKLTKPKK